MGRGTQVIAYMVHVSLGVVLLEGFWGELLCYNHAIKQYTEKTENLACFSFLLSLASLGNRGAPWPAQGRVRCYTVWSCLPLRHAVGETEALTVQVTGQGWSASGALALP